MYLTQCPCYILTPLYYDTSLFWQMEITPINSEFHKFLLRTIIFLPTFHYFGIPLFQYLFTFPHRKHKS